MNKFIFLVCAVAVLGACNTGRQNSNVSSETFGNPKKQINSMLDSFHRAAAEAQFDLYFRFFADSAIFIGTDALENWNKNDFMAWAKPIFNKKRTWNFTPLKRNIFMNDRADVAWFDELLSTQMKICRGSGVVIKVKNQWKVKHYVLSMTIPNPVGKKVIEIKTPIEDSLIKSGF